MPKYTAYKGTRYEYKTSVPSTKKFDGKVYHLTDIFANYGQWNGHKTAKQLATTIRAQGNTARIVAHSGYTAVYSR